MQWNEGQVFCESVGTLPGCVEGVRNAKAEMELNLARNTKILISFFKDKSAQRTNPLLNCIESQVASRSREVIFPLYSVLM